MKKPIIKKELAEITYPANTHLAKTKTNKDVCIGSCLDNETNQLTAQAKIKTKNVDTGSFIKGVLSTIAIIGVSKGVEKILNRKKKKTTEDNITIITESKTLTEKLIDSEEITVTENTIVFSEH